ncbi:NLR family CARD domain-containing protein 3 [Gadus chalcogrammus]|uniref:NLR family CARD domain-containing protein 3 n=1 Tax=Gadus chalcogrammus TaxID=1042646 RepID=UPI0024C47528|nr:NLR family CARD domain-containing protein 3 [Gadus chalcogrammus]XP_056432812.1 NLR family CARD domain-containing protein 3 [Gadus chalcogrammus]
MSRGGRQYEALLGRSERVTWQRDCYMDLQSNPGGPPSKSDRDAHGSVWVHQHQQQLQRFTTASFLRRMLSHLRGQELLSVVDEMRVEDGGGRQVEEQVMTLLSLLASRAPHGPDALQAFVENSDSHEARLILTHDHMVKEHQTMLLQRLASSRDRMYNAPPSLSSASRGLLLVDGLSNLQQKEHDLMQVNTARGSGRIHLRPLALARLMEPLTRVSSSPRVSLTVGVAGIGKTALVRQFVTQWCLRKVCGDISFVLPLSFWELNSLEKVSAERLVRLAFPHLSDPALVLSGACRTLLIFDGLDEFRCRLNFSDASTCSDPKKEVSVEDLVTNIIRGNLLPNVSVWLTSRSAHAALIPVGLVDRLTEVPGFTSQDVHTFLHHCLPERDTAGQVWAHLESHKFLMVMSYIPCVCQIVMETLRFLLQKGSPDSLPRTCTELYAHFCAMNAEAGEPRGREPMRMEQVQASHRKLLGPLGRLAFYGLIKHKYTFGEQDLRAHGVDLPSAQGSHGAALLVREESAIFVAYRFTHLTVQEFLAATFYHVSSKRAIFDLFSESAMSWPKLGFQNHFRNALQRSQQDDGGHLDVLVRFLAGLLSPSAAKPLAALVGKDDCSQQVWAGGFLQSLLGPTGGSEGGAAVSLREVNLAYCLQELKHTELLWKVEEALSSGSLAGTLSRSHCVALAYLLQVSPECCQETNLSDCLNYSTVKCLLPQLLYCSHLRLENNHFKDNVMELLGSLLSAKDCQVQKISLADNSIGNLGAKALSRALLVNRTLTALDLRSNNIGAKGARFLAEALKMNQALVSINFQNNAIGEEGTRALADVLLVNRKLVSLNIQNNAIGPGGARRLAEALKTNQALTELNLCSNQLGDGGATALAQALVENRTLLSLHLQSNSISDRGMTALTRSLRTNQCLQSLNLRENSVGVVGARNMAAALRENGALHNLDLTANLLHDEGVQAIAGAIGVNQSLTSLHLQWNFIKVGATKALAHALTSNTSLNLLDLQENCIGDEGMVCLANALKNNCSLKTLCLQGVSAGRSGAIAMATALMVNHSLHTLDLRGNSIGMEGAKALASALKHNHSLKSLNLQENGLGMDGAIFIATALRANHQLTYINLQGNGIGESGAKVISDTIRTNSPDCVVMI